MRHLATVPHFCTALCMRSDAGRTQRWQMWASQLDKTTGVRRLARDVTPPVDDRPAPERITTGGAKDLAHLASWCFTEI